ncbi:MAG TPA: hypothetical protein PKU80_06565 [Candidatus Limiplasma sp.]|nr:hypothetical protein [Candidatus Limiplasma sp.]
MHSRERKALVCLTCPELYALMKVVCTRFGLMRLAYADIRQLHGTATPLPLHTQSDTGYLWVDKYYLAYQLDADVLRYAYLTRTHVREEMRSYFEAADERARSVRLPTTVAVAFKKASCNANQYRPETWVGAAYHPLLRGG